MNDKKLIETYKLVRADLETLPRPLPPEAIEDIKRMIDNGLAEAKANPKPETRSLAEIVAAIEANKNKSPVRKDLEIRLAEIADRMHSKRALTVSDNPSRSEQADEPLQLHERIKFLRQS